MRLHTLFVLSILSCLCFALGQGSYDDCCLKYLRNSERFLHKFAVNYRFQKTDGSCNIPAIVFITKKQRLFCTHQGDAWVQRLMRKIDHKKAKPSVRRPQKQPHKG